MKLIGGFWCRLQVDKYSDDDKKMVVVVVGELGSPYIEIFVTTTFQYHIILVTNTVKRLNSEMRDTWRRSDNKNVMMRNT